MTEPIPDPGSEFEEEGIPDHEGPLPEKVDTGDAQEGLTPPSDYPSHSYDYGVTLDEQREGATIGTRLSEEQPEHEPDLDPEASSGEPYPSDREEHGGRVVAPGEAHPSTPRRTPSGTTLAPIAAATPARNARCTSIRKARREQGEGAACHLVWRRSPSP